MLKQLILVSLLMKISKSADVELRPRNEDFTKDCTPLQKCVYFKELCDFEKQSSDLQLDYMYEFNNEHVSKEFAETIVRLQRQEYYSFYECAQVNVYCDKRWKSEEDKEILKFQTRLRRCEAYMMFAASDKLYGTRKPDPSDIRTEQKYKEIMDKLIRHYSMEKFAIKTCFTEYCAPC